MLFLVAGLIPTLLVGSCLLSVIDLVRGIAIKNDPNFRSDRIKAAGMCWLSSSTGSRAAKPHYGEPNQRLRAREASMISFEIQTDDRIPQGVFCEILAENVRRQGVAGVAKLCEVIDALGVETAQRIRLPGDSDREAAVSSLVPIDGGYEAVMYECAGASRQAVRIFRDGTVEIVELRRRSWGKLSNFFFPVFECGIFAAKLDGNSNAGIHRAIIVRCFYAEQAAKKNGGRCTASRLETGATMRGFPLEMPGEIIHWE